MHRVELKDILFIIHFTGNNGFLMHRVELKDCLLQDNGSDTDCS